MKPNTCLVVDVWEGQLEIDEAVLKANGVAGIGIRLNDMNGGHHMDTNFTNQWAQAKVFVRFPYFVYNPWVNGQANYDWLLANIPAEAKSVAVDMEVRYPGYPASTYAAEFAKFMTLATKKWKVIIYTAQWFLPYLSYWPKTDYWWAQYPDPNTYFKGCTTWDDLKTRLDDDKLNTPFNARYCPGTIKMWQFSGDYLILPGTVRDIDVNLFFGTAQQLSDYFLSVPQGTPAPDPIPNPPPTPTPDPAEPVFEKSFLYTFAANNFYRRPGNGPLTMPMSRQTKLGDNITRYLWAALRPTLLRLNYRHPDMLDLISAPDWGPSKGLDGPYIRWIGLLWPGRNIVKVGEVVDYKGEKWGKVMGVALDKLSTLDQYDTPHLVHEVFDYHNTKGYGVRAKRTWVPIMGGPWWAQMERLVSVDAQLPKKVRITAFPRLRVRASADTNSEIVDYVYYNSEQTVISVKIGSGGIWGQINKGWIALRHYDTNWTSWII